MRRLALLVAVCAAAVGVAGANAAQPQQFAIQVHESFVAPFMSAACGVPVTITLDGVSRVTLTRNSSGLVVKEHDVLSSFTAIFESPLALGGTGQSFTNHSPGVATFDYGEGAAIGSTAVITLTGLQGPCSRRGVVGHGRVPAADGHRVRLLTRGDPTRRLRRACDLAARRVARLLRRGPPGAVRGARRGRAAVASSSEWHVMWPCRGSASATRLRAQPVLRSAAAIPAIERRSGSRAASSPAR